MTTLQDSVCPHCGAVLNFTASTKVVHCDFCDSDIIIEQNQIPERNIPLQQMKNFPPGIPFDETAFRKWKKKYHTCHVILSVLIIIFMREITNAKNVILYVKHVLPKAQIRKIIAYYVLILKIEY